MIGAFRQLAPYAQTLSRSIATETYFIGHKAGSYETWDATAEAPRPPAWADPEAEKPEGASSSALVGRDMEDLDWKLNKYGELLPEIMDITERELAQEALDLWAGFEAFCAEGMGVGAEKILAVTLQGETGAEAVSRVGDLKDLAERLDLEPDTDAVKEARDTLLEAWRVVERSGT
ncbi:MAG: hypothetical protein ICV57_07375 [Rubrobacter sp.]|nr:hypothetical protein [Rubrobacter sp.]